MVQKGSVTKNHGELDLSKIQTQKGLAQFGTVMRDVLVSAQTKLTDSGEIGQNIALVDLEQGIAILSAETESLLINNADPEAVEDILSQAVTQLWELIGDFDIQNGTQYVPEISKDLIEIAEATADAQSATDVSEVLSGAFVQITNPLIAQPVASEVSISKGRVDAPLFTTVTDLLSKSQAVVQNGTQTSVASQTITQAHPKTSDTPLFATITDVQPKSQILVQNSPQSGTATQTITNTSVLEGIDVIPKAASDWPQKIQQFIGEAPLKKKHREGDVTRQSGAELNRGGNKVNTDILHLTGVIDVKAKVKELLTLSAQANVSNTNASGGLVENSGQLLLTRTEQQSLNATVLTEQARPARNFGQNVANQIQGRTLGEGITRIELAPRGLGNILVELKTKDAGDIQVIVKAENPVVLNALRIDRETLLSVLSNEISNQEGVDLEFEEFGEGQLNHGGDGLIPSEESAQSEIENEEDANPSSAKERTQGVGQLDILT